jgi:uncharacterized protein (DUF427 family)
MTTWITISDGTRGEIIAQAGLDHGVFTFEGNYYFDPERVTMDHLVVTERVYICPYKGRALWIDLQTEHGVIKDVAWVYHAPKPGYTQIAGKIGFYDGTRPGTVAERSEQHTTSELA